MRRSTCLLAVVCSLLLGTAGTAAAQVSIGVPPTLLTWSCGNVSATDSSYCGQSFTVPTSHSILQSFTFHIATPTELQFHIFAYSDVMSPPALFTQSVAATDGAGTSPQTFAPPGGLALTPGALYLALVQTVPGQRMTLQANPNNVYSDGQFVGCNVTEGTFWCRNPGRPVSSHDAAFEATFVSAQTTAPEPATVALLGGGLLALGGVGLMRRGHA